MLTLRDLVEKIPSNLYKTIRVSKFDFAGDGILYGYCQYKNNELVSLDGKLITPDDDDYSLNDEILEFQIVANKNNEPELVVYLLTELCFIRNATPISTQIKSRYDAQQLKEKLK